MRTQEQEANGTLMAHVEWLWNMHATGCKAEKATRKWVLGMRQGLQRSGRDIKRRVIRRRGLSLGPAHHSQAYRRQQANLALLVT